MINTLEPGVLRIFRWYVGIRWGLLLLVLGGTRGVNPPDPPQFPLPGVVLFGLLFALLMLPVAQQWLGRAFLPLTITLATIAPIVDGAATIAGRLDAGLTPNEALGDYWLVFFLLFVPFILTAWQYRFRWVLVFAVLSTLLDMIVIGAILRETSAQVSVVGALLFARGALFAFLGIFISKLVARQRDANLAIRSQASAMEQLATGRERNRLARELHDTLAHSMTATAVQLEAVKALWDEDPVKAKEILEQALDRTRDGLNEARRAIAALRATPLDDLGLRGALEWLANEAMATSRARTTLVATGPTDSIEPSLEDATFRIASEAMNNAIRHGDPDLVNVSLNVTSTRLQLIVDDDGTGISPGDDRNGHHGITGMNERAEMVGGSVEIKPGQNGGTVVTFSAPVGP